MFDYLKLRQWENTLDYISAVAFGQNNYLQVVGNKAKGQISKWVFQENKAHQVFRKTNIFYPLVPKSTSAKCSFFGKIDVLSHKTPVLRFE